MKMAMKTVPECLWKIRIQTPRVKDAVGGVSEPDGHTNDATLCDLWNASTELQSEHQLPCQAN